MGSIMLVLGFIMLVLGFILGVSIILLGFIMDVRETSFCRFSFELVMLTISVDEIEIEFCHSRYYLGEGVR